MNAAPVVRRRVSERDFQQQVISLARLNRWTIAHFHDSRRQVRPKVFVGDKDAAGFPDLVCVRERVVFAELKAEYGKLSASQERWFKALALAGAEVYVWRPSSWPEITQTLSTPGARAVA